MTEAPKKEGWRDVTLGEIFEISSSKRVLQEQWQTSGVPFYRAREIVKLSKNGVVKNEVFISEELFDEYRKRYGVPAPGDLMVSAVGTLGACYIVQSEDRFYYKDASVLRFSPKEAVHSKFIQYAFGTNQILDQVNGGSGSTVGTFTIERANKTRMELPPLPEQRRIAEILDKAEALRAKRRAALTQLDTFTQSIFLDMFGDSGVNPKCWPIQRVSDYVAAFQGGKSIESESDENIETRNRVLKVSAVTRMKFLAHESKPVPDSYEPPPEHFARAGDLLFSRANTTELVGAVAYVKSTPQNVLLPDKLWRFVWRQPAKVEPLFVWVLFQTPSIRREIGRRATGTSGSMKNISQEKVFGISTILPPLSLQQEFVRRVASVEKLKTTQLASLAEFSALFSALQYRAFRGEL